MTSAFGCSAGDFITAVGLIVKVSKALKESGGAPEDYQQVVQELNALELILLQLEALKPSDENVGYVNAIRCLALACRHLLEAFLTKIKKFENSLGVQSTRNRLMSSQRKAQWAVFMSAEVPKLRAVFVAKVLSIQTLLESSNL